jgi:hypothetical protein
VKIFEYDPATGKRGKLLGHGKIASWCGESMKYAIGAGHVDPIDYAEPVFWGKDADVTVHVDAGRGEKSYKHPSKWICFCIGNWRNGTEEGVWTWAVIPPKGVAEAKEEA